MGETNVLSNETLGEETKNEGPLRGGMTGGQPEEREENNSNLCISRKHCLIEHLGQEETRICR